MLTNSKLAVVTGATSGIGLATARLLAETGHRVVALGRNLDEVAPMLGDRGEAIATDVRDPAQLAAAFARLTQPIDILVIAAGVSNAPSIGALDPAHYDALMDVNCRGATFAFVHALPHLADGAAVVFVGSVGGRKGQPGDALYAGSKGFIRAFVRSAGTDPELLARGIRVNCVSPGPIRTPLTLAAHGDPAVSTYVEQQLVPMHRWGTAEEVARAIVFLASPAASFTTGADLTVDGGMAHA